MTKTILIIVFMTFLTDLTGQNRLDSLVGDWHLQKYFSHLKKMDIESWNPNVCQDFLILSINKKGKLRIIFTDHKDTIVFLGHVRTKNNSIKISNNIHEIIYLGELEKCITPGLREDIRGAFFRIYNFNIKYKKLIFYYNLPTDPTDIKTMVLTRT